MECESCRRLNAVANDLRAELAKCGAELAALKSGPGSVIDLGNQLWAVSSLYGKEQVTTTQLKADATKQRVRAEEAERELARCGGERDAIMWAAEHSVCYVCRRPKAPVGRSVPLEASSGYCVTECPGHDRGIRAPRYWPREIENERDEWKEKAQEAKAELARCAGELASARSDWDSLRAYRADRDQVVRAKESAEKALAELTDDRDKLVNTGAELVSRAEAAEQRLRDETESHKAEVRAGLAWKSRAESAEAALASARQELARFEAGMWPDAAVEECAKLRSCEQEAVRRYEDEKRAHAATIAICGDAQAQRSDWRAKAESAEKALAESAEDKVVTPARLAEIEELMERCVEDDCPWSEMHDLCAALPKAWADRTKAERALAEAKAVLERVEWGGPSTPKVCPICLKPPPHRHYPGSTGHRSDCALAKVLGRETK